MTGIKALPNSSHPSLTSIREKTLHLQGWLVEADKSSSRIVIFDGTQDLEFLVEQACEIKWSALSKGSAISIDYTRGEQGIIQPKLIKVLSKSASWPLDVENVDLNRGASSRYRYLAFRDSSFQQRFLLRHKIWLAISNTLDKAGFIHIETPILAAPSTSGAQEYSVRSHRSARQYALPQSPQIYGHLLAIGGVKNYFQWSRCFRDEDLRANRQPEFSQLHLEMAFTDQKKIMEQVESIVKVALETAGIEISEAIQHMTFAESMKRFGTDKPNIRFAPVFKQLPCRIVDEKPLDVFAIKLPNTSKINNETISKICAFAERRRNSLAGFLPHNNNPIKTMMPREIGQQDLGGYLNLENNYTPDAQLVFIGEWQRHNRLSRDIYELLSSCSYVSDDLNFLWITDFPLFETDPENKGRLKSAGHPFLQPNQPERVMNLTRNSELLTETGQAMDLILNGEEIGSGSMLIGDPELQYKIFYAQGFSKKDIRRDFSSILDAVSYGAPPIGGFGLGFDRLMTSICRCDQIRDVIAFPKSRNGLCSVLE